MARLLVVQIGLRDELLAAALQIHGPIFVRLAELFGTAQSLKALADHEELIAGLEAGRVVRVPASYLSAALFKLGTDRDVCERIDMSGATFVVRPDGAYAPATAGRKKGEAHA